MTRRLDVVADPEVYRAACEELRAQASGDPDCTEPALGLVPTMGALHEGHLALVGEAQRRCRDVAVTIFVNPTQFGPGEDLARYPRDLDGDVELCREAGARLVFAPTAAAMYPPGEATRVRVHGLTSGLCGGSRPGHFDGVTTIVTKLLALTGPCVAVFGQKDYQQLAVIRRMVRDLLLPTTVVGHPIVREADGLALSSRNRFLDEAQRRQALAIPGSLEAAAAAFEAGATAEAVELATREALAGAGLVVDYVSVVDADSLEAAAPAATRQVAPRLLLAVAAFAGATRLIDNALLGEDLREEGAARADRKSGLS